MMDTRSIIRHAVTGFLLVLACDSGSARAAGGKETTVLATPLPNAPGLELDSIVVTYAPGAKSPPHVHDASAFVYVLSGKVRSKIAGQAVRVYRKGDAWFEPPGTHHEISENASVTEPALLLVVFIARPGARLSHPPHAPIARPAGGI